MEANVDPWREIADLIDREKKGALEEFHGRPFVPGGLPARRPAPLFRPAPALAAAALLLAAGLASLWLLRGGWKSAPAAPEWNEILAGTFLYGREGSPEEGTSAAGAVPVSAPYFTAWAAVLQRPAGGAEAGLERAAVAAVEPFDPAAPVERVDPGEVRQKIGRMIRAGAIERLLARMEKINKEV